MEQNNKHLDFDLEFLDKDEKGKTKPDSLSKTEETNTNIGIKHNWKVILIAVGIVLFFVWIFSSDNDDANNSSNYTPPVTNKTQIINKTPDYTNNQEERVIVGEYSCLIHHATKADQLQPSDFTKQQLNSESQRLDSLTIQLENLADEIELTYVDETSQYSVDAYNNLVDGYNIKQGAYLRDFDALDIKIDQYNIKVNIYNNYLENNCTKIK